MKKSLYYIILPLFLTGLASCQEEQLVSSDGGRFDITLVDKPTKTRVLPFDLSDELKAQFSLSIKDADGKRYFSGSMTDYSTGAPALRPDSYILQAEYGENPVLALDAPYYISEPTTAAIEADKVTSVELVCKVGNALASFAFSDPTVIADLMPDYTFVAQAGGQTVSCTADDGHNPYFKAGSTVDFYLTGITTEGKTVNQKFASITSAQPRMNYKYTLTIGDVPEGSADLDITVDTSVEEVQINETIPQEWLPKAKVSADGFDANNSIDYRETTDAVTAAINYQALMPVEDVELTLAMGDPELQALNKTYNLASLSAEDRTALENAGIVLPTLNSETGTVDLTGMTGRLQSGINGVTASNTITARVFANHRWSEASTYTINTYRPEFNLIVYPGDIWTREFTVNPMQESDVIAGKLENIQKKLSYQYSLNGIDWHDIPSTRQQTGLTPNTLYHVRAVYRGDIYSSPVQLTTYDNMQIPNSSLDEGYDISYPKSNNPLYTFKGDWIGTRNPMTCHSSGVNAFYVSKSGTIPKEENGSTVAELTTIGWGSGNTCNFGNKSGSVIKNISAGLVCVGNFDFSNNSVSAKEAYIRPTALSFTYKASPYNGDEYLIRIYLENHTGDAVYTIGTASLQSSEAQSSYITTSLPISYDAQYKEYSITHVQIEFYSGTKEDTDHLESKFRDAKLSEGYTNAYIIGSQFWLDSFSLIYDK